MTGSIPTNCGMGLEGTDLFGRFGMGVDGSELDGSFGVGAHGCGLYGIDERR